MSKLSHSNPDLDDVYTGEEELEKTYQVTFVPTKFLSLSHFFFFNYKYEVQAQDEDAAYEAGKRQLQEAIGWDAAKDWDCDDVEEVT